MITYCLKCDFWKKMRVDLKDKAWFLFSFAFCFFKNLYFMEGINLGSSLLA